MSQTMVKAPKSMRIVDFVLGAVTLIIAGLAIALLGFGLALLVLWLSISLLFAGFEGIIIGAAGKGLSRGQRTFRVIAGVIAVGLSIAVIAFPVAALISTVVILSTALLFLGGSAIGKGITEKFMSGWARAMYVIVGGVTVALSIALIASPAFGLLTVYSLMATILIINGAAYVIAGITGAVYVPIGISWAGRGKRQWESDAA